MNMGRGIEQMGPIAHKP
jgi:hypothetical protein